MDEINKNILISIIIPVFNIEEYIDECLESIINQDFNINKCELICIDDCSTDKSYEKLKTYEKKYSNIYVLHNNVNLGAGFSRNRGISCSRGKYLIFVDGDDVCDKHFLKYLYEGCENNNADVSICNLGLYNDRNEKWIHGLNTEIVPNTMRLELYGRLLFSPCIKMVLRKFIIVNNIRFQTILNCNDVSYSWLVISLANRIYFVNNSLYFYRNNRIGNLTSYSFKKSCCVLAYENVINELQKRQMWCGRLKKVILKRVIDNCYYFLKRGATNSTEFIIKISCYINDSEMRDINASGICRYQYECLIYGYKENIYQFYRNEIIKFLRNYKSIVLWGAGKLGDEFLKALGKEKKLISFVIDNDKNKQGTIFNGIPVCGYKHLDEFIQPVLILNPNYLEDIRRQVSESCLLINFNDFLDKL